jgi:hypothetical protein
MNERAQAIERLRREKQAAAEGAEALRRREQEAEAEARRAGHERGARDALAVPYAALKRHGTWWAARHSGLAHSSAQGPELPHAVAEAASAYEQEHHPSRPTIPDTLRVPSSVTGRVVSRVGPLERAFGEGWREAVAEYCEEVKDEL